MDLIDREVSLKLLSDGFAAAAAASSGVRMADIGQRNAMEWVLSDAIVVLYGSVLWAETKC